MNMSERRPGFRKAANDNFPAKGNTPMEPLAHEKPSGALLIAHVQGIRRITEEISASGDRSLLNEGTLRKAKQEINKDSLEQVIQAINLSREEDWRRNPAQYLACVEIIDEFRTDTGDLT